MISSRWIKRKVRAFGALPWRDRWILLQVWITLLIVDLALRTLPFPWLQAWASKGKSRTSDENAAVLQHTSRLVDMAANNHLYPMLCLRRSLVTQRLLNQRGISTELRFGAQREEGKLKAHAWLEHDGTPIGEPGDIESRFIPLLTPEARR